MKNDDEHKIARGIALKKSADAWSELIGMIGFILFFIIIFTGHKFIFALLVLFVSFAIAIDVYRAILKG